MVTKPHIEVLAVIPARGGSKSIPKKNIRNLGGHPLLAYSIAAALNCPQVNRVVLSTDDPAIAETGAAYGAEAPFLRPPHLAADDSRDFPLFEHLLAELAARENYHPDIIVQLRPTSPLRPPDLTGAAVETLANNPDADSVRTVTPSRNNPYKTWFINQNVLSPILTCEIAEAYNAPRQDLPATYWQTGHVDVFRSATVLHLRSLTGNRIVPLLVAPEYCIDIDSLLDWECAEVRMQSRQLNYVKPERHKAIGAALEFVPALVVFDFDGVFTDNCVLVGAAGDEYVRCNRSDGLGVASLCAQGVPAIVLSSEANPVVGARCRKLRIDCVQGIADKASALKEIAAGRGIPLSALLYVGNDLNDAECMELAGMSIAVNDAHPLIKRKASRVLDRCGGQGAIQEVAELIARTKEGNRSCQEQFSSALGA